MNGLVFTRVFAALNGRGCRYVVVGGLAAVLHGYSRLTADIDLAIDLEAEEASKVMQALGELGMAPRLPAVALADFLSPETRREWQAQRNMVVFSLHHPSDPLLSVDLFVDNPIDFASLWDRAEDLALDGLSVKVASIPDLIHLKTLAGRAQDLQDIAYLQQIRAKRQTP